MLDADHQHPLGGGGPVTPGERVRGRVGALVVIRGRIHSVVRDPERARVVPHEHEGAPGMGPHEEAAVEELLGDPLEPHRVATPDGLDGDVPQENPGVVDSIPARMRQEALEDLGVLQLERCEVQRVGGPDGLLVRVEEGDDLLPRALVRVQGSISPSENEGRRNEQDHSKTTQHGHSSGSRRGPPRLKA